MHYLHRPAMNYLKLTKPLVIYMFILMLIACGSESGDVINTNDTFSASPQKTTTYREGSNTYINQQIQAKLGEFIYYPISTEDFLEHYVEFSAQVSSTNFMLSEPQTFTIPENTQSFSLNFHTPQAGSDVFLAELQNPNGEIIYLSKVIPCFNNNCSMVMPNRPGPLYAATAGEWHYRVAAEANVIEKNLLNTTFLNLLIRVNPNKDIDIPAGNIQGVLPIQAWYSGDIPAEHVTNIMNKLITVFKDNEIGVHWSAPKYVHESNLATVPPSFTHKKTQQLLSRGEADIINIYFIKGFDEQEPSVSNQAHPGVAHDVEFLLGVAAGIPGTLGTKGGANGVLIAAGIQGGPDDYLLFNADYSAAVAAHEIGHFIGLFHTTERSGKSFDVLDDTEKCEPTGTDGISGSDTARCPDGHNLMFPFARSDDEEDTRLTEQQRFVIRSSPLAR
jgi:hypothetical protein